MGRKGDRGMTIETKYNIGEEVWCLVKGKPYKVTITAYKLDLCGTTDDCDEYYKNW